MDGLSCTTQDLPDGCQEYKTFLEAQAICTADGLRLCSEAEVETGVCCGSGCGFDGHQIWTDEPEEITAVEPEGQVIPTYNYGAMFTNSCPSSGVSESACLAAVQSLLGSDQYQGRSSLVAGSWGWVPPGCSVQSHFTHGRVGDFAAHYNRNDGGNNDGGYTPVCSSQCQHLHNQDVVGGTFSHYGADHADSPSDAACSAS